MTALDARKLPYDASAASSWNLELVGYHDLEDRGALKLGLYTVGDRWYLFAGSLWHSGLSILDVTTPTQPELVRWLEGPADTWTFQLQVADGKLIWGFEHPSPGWGKELSESSAEGFRVYEVSDPDNPALLGQWSTGTDRGTHRNFYDGGRYVHCSASAPGFDGHIYRIVDIADPGAPVEAGRWWLPDQWLAGAVDQSQTGSMGLHGPAYVDGDRAYLSYTDSGMVILDVSDLSLPRLVSRLDMGSAIGSALGVHSVIPLTSRKLAVINSESLKEGGSRHEPLNYALIVDIADEAHPRVISWLPVPVPPRGSPYASFHEKPGRFGPHNQHHWQHHPDLLHREDRVYLTYFNAGLRVFDISNAYVPREVGYFVPPDPTTRIGLLPTQLVTQFEDVLVDRRGYIYTTDKNWGIHILRETSTEGD